MTPAVTPLHRVAVINSKTLPEDVDAGHRMLYADLAAVDLETATVTPRLESFASAPSRARRLVEVGDSLIPYLTGGISWTQTRPLLVDNSELAAVVFSTGFYSVTPRANIDERFLNYCMSGRGFLESLDAVSAGVTMRGFTQEQLARCQVWVPEIAIQRAIADYLDAETARIDALIAKKERMLELLAQEHRCRVRSATCDSSSERPLRRVAGMIKTGTTPSSEAEVISDGVEWVTPGDFGDGLLLPATTRRISRLAVQAKEAPLFPPGSILVVGIGATAGKVAFADRPVSSNQQITAVVPGPQVDGRFIAWQLWSRTEELRDLAPFTTLPILSNNFLRSFPVNVPALSVQRDIAQAIDKRWLRSQALQLGLQRQIELLREHRQALITAAVTGELDIPGVAA